MRVRIHRGAREIGGNCIEFQASGKTLLLDLGLPLSLSDPRDAVLPDVPGLREEGDPDFLGVVISHPHPDHYGLVPYVHPNTPIYIGYKAHQILKAARPFSPFGADFDRVTCYRHRQPFSVGPFRITPFLNDHSAFDAYSLLVEADHRRLFYTGDFRGHGRKGRLFERLLQFPPAKIDVLLMEGTTVGRDGEGQAARTEEELEKDIVTSLKATEGLALACFSAQNIDRFVTFFRAAKRASRRFVVDLYMAHILDAIGLPSLPSPRSSDLRVFLPRRMKRHMVRHDRIDLVTPYDHRRIYLSEIAKRAGELVMLFRPNMAEELATAGCLSGAKLFYSLWPGYLDRDPNMNLVEWCGSNGIAFEIHHTSGHADWVTLARLAETLAAESIVPIHCAAPEQFASLFSNVRRVEDGEWWDV